MSWQQTLELRLSLIKIKRTQSVSCVCGLILMTTPPARTKFITTQERGRIRSGVS